VRIYGEIFRERLVITSNMSTRTQRSLITWSALAEGCT
jgi:hypothetical protein